MNLKKFLIRICSRAGVILKGRQCIKEPIVFQGKRGRTGH